MDKEAPRPRLCHVRKTFPEQEYGFNLHAEKGKGQFIGSVDAGSPADLAGLRASDRIFAVNGAVIVHEDHKKVVSRIKEDPLQCHMLVIEEEGESWYRERGLHITPDMPNILFCSADSSEIHHHESRGTLPPPDYDAVADDPEDRYSPNFYSSDKQAVHIERHVEPVIETRTSSGVKPRPRLCKVQKKSPQDEYGFNLHAEKGRGHFIGKVDDGSLAERSGLEQGQRIVGVNGTLIYPATPHKDVVFLIKTDTLCANLLVASPEVDEWYRSRDVPFSFQDAEVMDETRSPPISPPALISSPKDPRITESAELTRRVNGHHHEAMNGSAPPPQQSIGGYHHDENDRLSSATTSSAASDRSGGGHDVTVISVTETPPPPNHDKDHRDVYNGGHQQQSSPVSNNHDNGIVRKGSHSSSVSSHSTHSGGVSNGAIVNKPQPVRAPPPSSAPRAHPQSNDLEPLFRLSAAEMREQLSRKKKANPKGEPMSMQQKFEIVKNL